jgi:amino acid transporter
MAKKVETESTTLGILSIIFAFVSSAVGLILGIIGMKKGKEYEERTGKKSELRKLSKIGVICASIMTGIAVVVVVIILVIPMIGFCAENGPGVYYKDGVTYTCKETTWMWKW